MTKADVGLVALMHDPDGGFLPYLDRLLPVISNLYQFVSVMATPVTSTETVAALRSHGCKISLDGVKQIGESRRRAVRFGLAQPPVGLLHYCDFDRLVHWELTHPQELEAFVKDELQGEGYFAIGRTGRAFATHPTVQIVAEDLTNRLFAVAFGRINETLDVTAGSNAMCRKSAELVLKHSIEPTNATDCEWPMIIQKYSDLPIQFKQTEGLEFETATFMGEAAFERTKSGAHWQARIELARESVEAALRLSRFLQEK